MMSSGAQGNEMRPIRICIVSGSYPPARCGVGDYADILANALSRRGMEVVVLTSGYLGISRRFGNPAVLPVISEWSIARIGRVVWQIMKAKPHIVHFQFPTSEYHKHRLFDILVGVIRLLPGARKVVVTLHEPVTIKKTRYRWLFRPLRHWLSLRWANGIIVVDGTYYKALQRVSDHLRLTPHITIPIGSNIPTSTLTGEGRDRLRDGLGVPRSTLLLSYFGFIQPRKGIEKALEVVERVNGQGIAAVLLIVGELSGDNEYHREVLIKIEQRQLKSVVKVTGFVNRREVSDFLAVSDACVLPFVDGVQPKRGSFMAALQQGVFTVTTSEDRSGFDSEQNVYYTRIGDVEEMVRGIVCYATERSCRMIGRTDSWGPIADKHVEFFRKILGWECDQEII